MLVQILLKTIGIFVIIMLFISPMFGVSSLTIMLSLVMTVTMFMSIVIWAALDQWPIVNITLQFILYMIAAYVLLDTIRNHNSDEMEG